MSKKIVRRAGALAGGAALTMAIAASPALAAGGSFDSPQAATGKSVIVDGVRKSADQMKALRGERLFIVAAKQGGDTFAFSSKADFKAHVRRQLGVKLSDKKPRNGPSGKARAKATWHGDYASFYTDANGFGYRLNINSGYGERDLSFVGCFMWWCSNYNDQISSVSTNAVGAMLYSETVYGGWTYYVGPYQRHNIAPWFNNLASSAYVYW